MRNLTVVNANARIARAARSAVARATLAVAALPALAHAHPGLAPEPHDLWRTWPASPGVVAGLVAAGAWYAVGVRRAWARAGAGRGIVRWRAWAYVAGLVALALALLTPLDAMADALFTAHMGQHLVLILVAAPLLAAGVPALAMLWAFPDGTRVRVGRVWAARARVRAAAALLASPGVAITLHLASVLFWHAPAPYDWALRRPAVHALEHVTLLGAAALFWWPVVRPAPRHRSHAPLRFGDGARLLYVTAAGVPMALLGAALTFAVRPWYTGHYGTTAAWGLTPLEDQQLAGVIMWVPAGIVYLGVASALFVRWLRESDAPSPIRRPAARAAAVAVCAATIAGGPSACRDAHGGTPTWLVEGGDATRGPAAMRRYGCGSCHAIPGVARPVDAEVGPPLDRYGRRVYIVGRLPNTPQNLTAWLRTTQQYEPGGAMPNLDVTDRDARDIAAYLYTLR